MTTFLRRTAIAAAIAIAALGQAGAQVSDYRDIKSPALRSFDPPQPKRIELPNGMVIFLMEDHELPLVRGTAMIRGGERNVPADHAGLSGIYGQAWRTGGTPKHTGDQLDEILESRAARIETSGGEASTSIGLDVLKGDFDFVFPLWLDLLRNPEFRAEKIELAKTQASTAISRRNDEPGGILAREATKLGYGAASSYARQPEYSTLANISRDDLLAFHKRYVHPNNIVLGFVGDFDSAAMEKRLRDTFASWQRGPDAPPAPADIEPAKPGVYFVPKTDVTQTNISVIAPGTTRRNPDYFAILVMNEILGGGFSGRLMNQLRSKMGLTYGVSGAIGADWDHPGLFRITTSTKSESTMQTVRAVQQEMANLLTQPFTEEELSLAKEALLNAFVFTRDTRAKIITQQMQLELYDYPLDFYTRYPEMVRNVTAADVARVAKANVDPKNVRVLVVGNEAQFDEPLSKLGPVVPIDIAIPEPGATNKPAAPAASSADGKALAQKVRQWAGNVGAVKAIRTTGTMTMVTPQGEMQADVVSLIRFPDTQRVTMKLPMGEIITVISPTAAFAITPMGTQDMPASQRDAMMQDVKTDPIAILQNLDNPKYTFSLGATEKVGETNAQVLEVNADGAAVTWLVDPSTGRLLAIRSRARGPMPGEQLAQFGEWREYGGVQQPTQTTILRNGEKGGEVKVSAVEVNPTIDESMFAKPQK